MRLVEFQPLHADEVARMHRQALPSGFLSQLGDGLLGELYHGLSLHDRSCVWVAEDDHGRPCGFVAGAADIRASYRSLLLHRGHRLAPRLLPSLARPAVWQRVGETLLYPFRPHRTESGDEIPGAANLPTAELLSLAVDASTRGQGAGRKLVERLERSLRNWGITDYRVVTDAEDPRSNGFYTSVGFESCGRFVHHAHPMMLYRKALPQTAEAQA